jgi:hypothetical protein
VQNAPQLSCSWAVALTLSWVGVDAYRMFKLVNGRVVVIVREPLPVSPVCDAVRLIPLTYDEKTEGS